MLWIFSPSRRYLIINAIVGNNQMNEIKFTDPFLCVIFHTGEKFQRKVGKQRFITWYFWISNCRKNEVNICGSEKKMMQWRHCTDALQMQRAGCTDLRCRHPELPRLVTSSFALPPVPVSMRTMTSQFPGRESTLIPGRWTNIRGFYRTSPWLVAFCAGTNGLWNKTTRSA